MFSPSVAAMVKPSPQDTLVTIFPPKGPTRTCTPWCFLKSFTPCCPYLLQPKVSRRPRAAKPHITWNNVSLKHWHFFFSTCRGKILASFCSTINGSCVGLPWSYEVDLESWQLLCQGKGGDVRDPLVTLVWCKQKWKKCLSIAASPSGYIITIL